VVLVNDINQFTFFKDYYNVLNELKKEDKRILLEAIVDYIFTDKEPTLTGLNKAIWNLLKRPLNTSKNKSNNAKKDIQIQIKTKSNENQNKIKTKSNKNQNEINDTISISLSNSISNSNLEKDSMKGKTFIVPTVEEIQDYCKERNNKVNPQKFYDFYESKGWMVGKNKMKDWKASVRTWEKEDDKTPDWFGKEIKEDKLSAEEEAKLKESLKKFS
jgi:hypothetical protein